MKSIFHVCFLFFLTNLSSQNISVKYTNIYDLSVPMTRQSRIIIDPLTLFSVYHEDFNSTKRIGKNGNEESSAAIASVKRSLDKYFVTDSDCKRFLYDDFALKNYKVEDNHPFTDWDISEESKLIAGFRTYKASSEFRGRKWIVWFTPDIPFPYGPWKFCGLPGLILEAHDAEKQWTYVAKEINLNSKDQIMIPDDKLFTKVSIKEFVTLKDEFHTNFLNSVDQDEREAVMVEKRNLRAGIETKFEWE